MTYVVLKVYLYDPIDCVKPAVATAMERDALWRKVADRKYGSQWGGLSSGVLS